MGGCWWWGGDRLSHTHTHTHTHTHIYTSDYTAPVLYCELFYRLFLVTTPPPTPSTPPPTPCLFFKTFHRNTKQTWLKNQQFPAPAATICNHLFMYQGLFSCLLLEIVYLLMFAISVLQKDKLCVLIFENPRHIFAFYLFLFLVLLLLLLFLFLFFLFFLTGALAEPESIY